MKIIRYIPIIAILIVSVSAFFAGFMQNDYSVEADSLRKQRDDLQYQISRMEAKANSIYIHDIQNNDLGITYLFDAIMLDNQLSIVNDTLLPEQRDEYLTQIAWNLRWYSFTQTTLEEVKMFFHFQNTTSDYIIASKEIDGYEYNISKNLFDSIQPAKNTSAFDFYGDYYSYDSIILIGHAPKFIVQWADTGDSRWILRIPIDNLQAEVNSLSGQITDYEKQSESIGLWVSLTTVAAILSAAMANRVNEKKTDHDLSVIRADITDQKTRIVPETDLISIPILLLAALLSSLGVLIPILL